MPFIDSAAFSIRPYSALDRDAVLSVVASNSRELFAPAETQELEEFLGAPRSDLLMAASASGETAGFGGGYIRSPTNGGLAWGMVSRPWHRRGVGRALLDARIARLCRAACFRFACEPVSAAQGALSAPVLWRRRWQ